jgi:hypothetical protein
MLGPIVFATSGDDEPTMTMTNQALDGFSGTVIRSGPDDPGVAAVRAVTDWSRILASGIEPREVTLVGAGGSAATAMDIHVALALGARVGIVEVAGGAPAKVARDRDWTRLLSSEHHAHEWPAAGQLVMLPADEQTIRAFVGPGATRLPERDRDALAEMVHDAYRDVARQRHVDDASLREFAQLSPTLRDSNYHQADDIVAKVTTIGYSLHRVGRDAVKRIAFDSEEIERLAEMEHGRWNAERLTAGWSHGDAKDEAARTHPNLVAWADLPDELRDFDRAAVRAIPDQLAAIGFELRRGDD